MIVFPVISSVISLLCAGVLVHDARRRPRPDKIIWAIAFMMFALAAGADAAGRSIGWTPWLARLYYSTGPALVVMFLAIGELYLLVPKAMSRFGAGATVLLSALWVAMVVNAPIDHSRLSADGWEAIDRAPVMVLITVLINAIGTTIIVGGTGYSVWKFWRQGIMRNRMIGCALIALGTLAVGAGGTLTRLGHYEYLYIAMSIGIALIFAGVLSTRRPDIIKAPVANAMASPQLVRPASRGGNVRGALNAAVAPATNGVLAANSGLDQATFSTSTVAATLELGSAIGYIEGVLLPLSGNEMTWICEEWSVPRDATLVFSRAEARQVWSFRQRLTPDGMRAFDRHSVMARRQLATLHDEVLTAREPNTPQRSSEPGHSRSVGAGPVSTVPPVMREVEADATADLYDDLAVPYS
ncbi:MAG: hypothetical protein ACR2OU_09685 [Thermomicrobiales bacterium]